MDEPPFRSGIVTVAGPPNTGKSTLVNALVGSKVAITTPVPQTTRTALRGIVHRPEAQIVLVDTPGIHRPLHRLGEGMVRTARNRLAEGDVTLFVADASRPPGEEAHLAAEAVRASAVPVLAAVNKCDRASAEEIDRVTRWLQDALGPVEVHVISALRGDGLEALVEALIRRLPPGPPLFPEGDRTDQPLAVLIQEIIREKAILHTRDEVPHSIAVEVEDLQPRPERGITYIRATVHVERPSQKKILIGEGGRMIREIGRASREEIESLLGSRVYLDLWVTVSEGWRERVDRLRQFYPDLARDVPSP
jgi:GTP-binding protein Era